MFADVNNNMTIAREEIFGPVLCIIGYDSEDDAIAIANDTPYGLAAYVWTNDIKRAHRVAHAIDTGMCWINSQNVRDLRTPFGGVGQSGMGREGGMEAMRFFTEAKNVGIAL